MIVGVVAYACGLQSLLIRSSCPKDTHAYGAENPLVWPTKVTWELLLLGGASLNLLPVLPWS